METRVLYCTIIGLLGVVVYLGAVYGFKYGYAQGTRDLMHRYETLYMPSPADYQEAQ